MMWVRAPVEQRVTEPKQADASATSCSSFEFCNVTVSSLRDTSTRKWQPNYRPISISQKMKPVIYVIKHRLYLLSIPQPRSTHSTLWLVFFQDEIILIRIQQQSIFRVQEVNPTLSQKLFGKCQVILTMVENSNHSVPTPLSSKRLLASVRIHVVVVMFTVSAAFLITFFHLNCNAVAIKSTISCTSTVLTICFT